MTTIPKIIENLNEEILQTAKELLLDKGYRVLTIRQVAGKCHIAVGTIYNYFPSKEMLVAGIMLKDWLTTMAYTRKKIDESSSCIEALKQIYDGVRGFSAIYERVWDEYGGAVKISGEYHKRMLDQLSQLTGMALEHFEVKAEPAPERFLAEILLSGGSRGDASFEELSPFLEKLLR